MLTRGMRDDSEVRQATAYRRRAEKLRAEATASTSLESKRALMAMANNYLQMARMIEEQTNLPGI